VGVRVSEQARVCGHLLGPALPDTGTKCNDLSDEGAGLQPLLTPSLSPGIWHIQPGARGQGAALCLSGPFKDGLPRAPWLELDHGEGAVRKNSC